MEEDIIEVQLMFLTKPRVPTAILSLRRYIYICVY